SVHRQDDLRLGRELAEALGPRVVHPEPALEVDLAGAVAALEEELDGRLRALPRRDSRLPEADLAHGSEPSASAMPSGAGRMVDPCRTVQLESTCSSSTSTSASPTCGARRTRSTSGTWRSSARSCAPRTARATATP